MKKVLTIAGSDCSGGAGIQADLKSISANGCFGMSVITSVVAENTSRVISVYNIPANEIELQIDAIFEDIQVDSVKLGMLPSAEIIESVAKKLKQYKPPVIVCDPVMVATSGDSLTTENTVAVMKEKLFPMVTLLTPNIPEAEAISGVKINGIDDFDSVADVILGMGVKNLLLKGGHFMGDAIDILYTHQLNDEGKYVNNSFCAKRVDSKNTHGTGCTLSSAIAANLANGMDITDAVEKAKDYITNSIANSFDVGKGHGPVNHFYDYYNMKGIK